ncbi:MAG TPA: glycosyltransferase, partial [Candidatus Saccharimonadales bacterium]|nr:glycosyltransferase [Candidatus Saccharimonadales bacterium]
GAERIAVDILKNLDREHFTPALLLFKDNNQGQELKAELAAANVPIISLHKRLLIDPLNITLIIRAVTKLKPDIIHTHLGGDIYGILAGRLNKVPVIVSTEHNVNKSAKKSAEFIKKINLKSVNKIFAVSNAVREDAITRYHLNPEKITVVYNGIDSAFFDPATVSDWLPGRIGGEKVVIGALGRLSQQKGFMSLIEAAAKTKNKNYLIEIAGVGEMAGELKKRIKDLELINRVRLIGPVNAKNFLSQIDIFILPSLWEGLGLVILEAGASLKPIIASQAGGIMEILNEENAWLFPVGDDDILAQKIDFLINNLNSLETKFKVEAVKNLVKEKFSLEKMITKYSNWYETLLNEVKQK